MPLTNAQLSADIAALIELQKEWQNLYSDWLGGTATGGPNGDGRYPLKDAQGVVSLVYCPAALASNVVGPSQQAEAWASAAEMHRMASQAAATLANSHKTFAEAAKVASQGARDLTQILRDQTAGMHSNVVYYAGLISANATTTSADRIAVAAMAANTANSASNAASSASSAAASANAAATFNPALFDLKTDGIASSRLTGVIDIDRIPVLPSQKTYTSSGGIADLTGPQQALIGEGTIITTTDGRRWVYTSGSKTSEASYTILADVTPSWSSITDKPSTFAASPHGHVWADLIDKPTSFTPSAHTHDWSVITGKPATFTPSTHTHLWADLTDKPTTFTPSAHTQDWSTITGRPDVAIQNSGVAFADLSVRAGSGGYVNLAPGNTDWTGYVQFFHANGNRAGYIGFANASGNQIRLVADGAGGFSFSHRPDFNGAVPWDSYNLPGPATTNTVQQINARKVFKSDVGGTAATASYTTRPLEVQSLASADDALMSFHIPGIRANTFGLRTNGDWAASGFKLWHEGNLDPANRPGLIINGTPASPSGLTLSFDGTGHAEIQSYASRNLLINRLGNGVGINRSSVTGGFSLDVGGNSLLAGTLLLGDKATLNGGAVMPTGKVLQNRAGNYATRAATNIAQFRHAAPNLTGAIVFKSSNTTRYIMQRYRIEGYLYETGKDIDLSLGFYNYTPNAFFELTLNQRGTNRPRVRIGYDAAGNTCLILGDVTTVWQYPHLVITEALLSHTDSETYLENWTSSAVTSLTGFVDVRDVTDSGLYNSASLKQVDIATPRDLPSQFTLVNGDGSADTRASFRGSYAIGVSKGGGGHFYLGATTAASPTLVFYRVDGAEVASLTPTGTFVATGGFQSALQTNARTRMWSLSQYDGYGISYFQATSGWGGVDTIGLHFGNAASHSDAAHKFRMGGDAYHSGQLSTGNGIVVNAGPSSFSGSVAFNSTVSFAQGSVTIGGDGLIYNSNWYRSTGQTGWYNSTYGTGIYSIAAGSVRTYNNASFTAEGSLNTLTANIYQNNGANRVPVTTVSQSAPSGGVDGDVHIVW